MNGTAGYGQPMQLNGQPVYPPYGQSAEPYGQPIQPYLNDPYQQNHQNYGQPMYNNPIS